jgi:hypothetical protein
MTEKQKEKAAEDIAAALAPFSDGTILGELEEHPLEKANLKAANKIALKLSATIEKVLSKIEA